MHFHSEGEKGATMDFCRLRIIHNFRVGLFILAGLNSIPAVATSDTPPANSDKGAVSQLESEADQTAARKIESALGESIDGYAGMAADARMVAVQKLVSDPTGAAKFSDSLRRLKPEIEDRPDLLVAALGINPKVIKPGSANYAKGKPGFSREPADYASLQPEEKKALEILAADAAISGPLKTYFLEQKRQANMSVCIGCEVPTGPNAQSLFSGKATGPMGSGSSIPSIASAPNGATTPCANGACGPANSGIQSACASGNCDGPQTATPGSSPCSTGNCGAQNGGDSGGGAGGAGGGGGSGGGGGGSGGPGGGPGGGSPGPGGFFPGGQMPPGQMAAGQSGGSGSGGGGSSSGSESGGASSGGSGASGATVPSVSAAGTFSTSRPSGKEASIPGLSYYSPDGSEDEKSPADFLPDQIVQPVLLGSSGQAQSSQPQRAAGDSPDGPQARRPAESESDSIDDSVLVDSSGHLNSEESGEE
jgi:hypothetical protein